MQTHHQPRPPAPGLRSVTPGLRQAEKWASAWAGMPKGTSKTRLLQLLEDIPADRLKVSKAALAYLHFTIKLQPKECFRSEADVRGEDLQKAGLALISTFSDDDLATGLDVNIRSLARYRAELAAAGLIAFRDSPDRTRWRVGRPEDPVDAYGIDLRPVIARWDELSALRDVVRAELQEHRQVRWTLSARRNRLRAISALLWNDDDRQSAERAIKAIDAVRRRKDIDMARLGLQEADEALAQLETALDAQFQEMEGLTEITGAPDETGAELLPTNDPNYSKNGLSEGGTRPQAGRNDPEPGVSDDRVGFIYHSDPGEDDETAEGRLLFEYRAPAETELEPYRRVTCPEAEHVLRALPSLLATKNMQFVTDRRFDTPKKLAIAYGQAAAHRIGFARHQIVEWSNRYGHMTFAVCALLSEFTPGVKLPNYYCRGLLKKLDSPWCKADLNASWHRLARQHASAANRPALDEEL